MSAAPEWFRGEPKTSRAELKTFWLRWHCPQLLCEGEMTFTGQVTPPPLVGAVHKCSKCGHTAMVMNQQFPRMAYEEVGATVQPAETQASIIETNLGVPS